MCAEIDQIGAIVADMTVLAESAEGFEDPPVGTEDVQGALIPM
jgi:hypothetical protein